MASAITLQTILAVAILLVAVAITGTPKAWAQGAGGSGGRFVPVLVAGGDVSHGRVAPSTQPKGGIQGGGYFVGGDVSGACVPLSLFAPVPDSRAFYNAGSTRNGRSSLYLVTDNWSSGG